VASICSDAIQTCSAGSVCALEEGFTMIEPGQWIRLAIIPWKIQLGAMERISQIIAIITGRVMGGRSGLIDPSCVPSSSSSIGRSTRGSAVLGRRGSARHRRAFGAVQQLCVPSERGTLEIQSVTNRCELRHDVVQSTR
jgi:hypothetical protein